jgi:hypothetical protein
MPNMRIITTNLADTATTYTATNAGTNAVAANMKTEYKSQAYRTSGLSTVFTLGWTTGVNINCVVLPCTNLSKLATIRVTSSTNGYDSGTVSACPNTTISDFSGANVNTFPYGGLSKTAVWFTATQSNITNLAITLTDTALSGTNGGNSAGYIDCSRIICGTYWQPSYNASKEGLSINTVDSTQTSRNDAGDLLAEKGFVYDQLQFNLDILTDTDRNTLIGLMKNLGTYKNLLISLFPEGNASSNEQTYMVYGKRENSTINYILPGFSSHSMNITGW